MSSKERHVREREWQSVPNRRASDETGKGYLLNYNILKTSDFDNI